MYKVLLALLLAIALVLPTQTWAAQTGQTMNPDISVILDGYYYTNSFKNSDDETMNHDLGEFYDELAGFSRGHDHGEEDHGHSHGVEPSEGFNLRHAEINLSGNIDPYFKAYAIAAISPEGAKLEVAQIETLGLPGGVKLKAGKFYSDFGRLNSQHKHEWSFVTPPLVNRLFFGDHHINDIGLQVSWLAPLDVYLEFGAEGFRNGGEENSFDYLGGDNLPHFNQPRVGIGWIKFGPDLGDEHGVLIGLSYIQGIRQEEHDEDDDDVIDHWLSGWARFIGLDLTYKYDAAAAYGQGDIVVQLEYYLRDIDMEVFNHVLEPDAIGERLTRKQDGLYLQMTFGLLPNVRFGGRYDHVGSFNTLTTPEDETSGFPPSNAVTFMTDVFFTEFSMLRAEVAYGEYELGDEGNVTGWSGGVQLTISLGTHGAHKF